MGPDLALRRMPRGLPDVDSDPELAARIAAEIRARGPMTFARFMELALYDPLGGYYTAETARPGRAGDFLTAPETHPIFGWALARQVVDVWQLLGRPSPFILREHGAGTGALAEAVLDRIAAEAPDLYPQLRYQTVEIEARRLVALADRLARAGHRDRLDPPEAAATAAPPIRGVILANEVIDALPVHRVRGLTGGEIEELYVGLTATGFEAVPGPPSTPALGARLTSEAVVLKPGQEAEICLAVDAWLAARAGELVSGVLLLIDYGHPAVELYDATRRPRGTLLGYQRHQAIDNPFQAIGRQDLTAHVDLTAVARAAVAGGLASVGSTSQAELLVSLGAGDLLTELQGGSLTGAAAYLEARVALIRLLDPAAMGRFRALAFGRGLPAGTTLRGFAYRLPGR